MDFRSGNLDWLGYLGPLLDLRTFMPREHTNMLLDMVENDMISAKEVLLMCLNWMNEDEIRDMMEANQLFEMEEL